MLADMKKSTVFIVALIAASLTRAESQPAGKAPDDITPATKPADSSAAATTTKPADAKTTPATSGTTAKTPAKKDDKKKVEEPKIPGITLTRANGSLLGLEIVGGKLKLSFYTAKKKPMAVDVTRANARWPNLKSATTGDYRTVLNGSGTALIGERPIMPPFAFNVYVNLIQGEGETAKTVESFVVPLHGAP